MGIWESIMFGVLASLVASFIFLGWTRLLTPKIEISQYISVLPTDNDDGKDGYRFKIINRRHRSVSDLTVSVFVQRHEAVPKGNLKVKARVGARSTIHSIPRRKWWGDKEFDNCRRIRIVTDDLESVFLSTTNPQVVVEIYCRDSWSGVGRVFRQEYAGISAFRHGSFFFGMNMGIEPYGGHRKMVLLTRLEEADAKRIAAKASESGAARSVPSPDPNSPATLTARTEQTYVVIAEGPATAVPPAVQSGPSTEEVRDGPRS